MAKLTNLNISSYIVTHIYDCSSGSGGGGGGGSRGGTSSGSGCGGGSCSHRCGHCHHHHPQNPSICDYSKFFCNLKMFVLWGEAPQKIMP